MKKLLLIILFITVFEKSSFAEENSPAINNNPQVEFYTSLEDFMSQHMISKVHLTIMSVTIPVTTSFTVSENIQLEKITVTQQSKESVNTVEEEVQPLVL